MRQEVHQGVKYAIEQQLKNYPYQHSAIQAAILNGVSLATTVLETVPSLTLAELRAIVFELSNEHKFKTMQTDKWPSPAPVCVERPVDRY